MSKGRIGPSMHSPDCTRSIVDRRSPVPLNDVPLNEE